MGIVDNLKNVFNIGESKRRSRLGVGISDWSDSQPWVRTVAGRLKSDYSYGTTTVYNTFPWCTPNDKQRAAIEAAAQKILDVRANSPDATLADLYDPLSMPAVLRKAHRSNDKVVAQAYGFADILDDEPVIVAALLRRYETLTK